MKCACVLDTRRGNLILGALAHHIQLALKSVFVCECATSYKNLLDVRLRTARHPSDRAREAGRVAPAKYGQSFFADNALENALALQARMFFHGQECHAYAISTGPGQLKAQLAALPLEKLMRNLEEDAGSVTGLGIASASSAMGQVEEHLDALAYDVMTFVAANIGDESDSAGIVFLRRMVQALGGRRSSRFVATRHHGHVCRIGSSAAPAASTCSCS